MPYNSSAAAQHGLTFESVFKNHKMWFKEQIVTNMDVEGKAVFLMYQTLNYVEFLACI